MSSDLTALERTCKQMVDNLLAGSRHTLCLNIAEPAFSAENVARAHLEAKGHKVLVHEEPGPARFADILCDDIGEDVVVITVFPDLDKAPKCIDLLLAHVQKTDVGGKLVVISRDWNSDNTAKERELRKHCLFYQQEKSS
jgi:hypothetical protein